MGGTEEIYTVRIKCRPDPSQKYPSERIYSSSTTGGLAITHILISILGGAVSYAIFLNTGDLVGGALLVTGAFLTGITGILAWKRWYVDHYVRWFFASSLVSLFSSLTTGSLTFYCLICPFLGRDYFLHINKEIYQEPVKELHLHLIVASIMEVFLCIISLKVSWKGVKKNNIKPILPVRTEGVGKERPDILNHKNDNPTYTNVMKELYNLQKSSIMANDGNKIISKFYEAHNENGGLPRPENQKEYQERMEKFLSSFPDGKET